MDQHLIKDISSRLGAFFIAVSQQCGKEDASMILAFMAYLRRIGIKSMELQVAETAFKQLADGSDFWQRPKRESDV